MILTSNYGEGHEQAAKAIQEAFQRRYPGVECEILDYMESTHPYIHKVSRYLFLQGVKKFPSAYGHLYNSTKNENPLSKLLKKGNRLGSSRLLELLRSRKPSMVVSTFPLAAGAMSALKQVGLTNVATATVITDHSHHNHWIYPHTDCYIVGSEYVRESLIAKHIQPERIHATGIPIRSEFGRRLDKRELKRKHGLDRHLPTLLLMGGGYGLFGDAIALLRGLEQLPFTLQILIVCGRNPHVERMLGAEAGHSKHVIHVMGHIDNVSEMMGAADLLLTKPGGLSTAEALAMGLPMILYNALPGQEEDNAKFLIRSGVALQGKHVRQLVESVETVICSPMLLQAMQDRTQLLERRNAADDAVHILRKLQQGERSRSGRERLLPSW